MSSAARARSRSLLAAALVGLTVASLVACAQGTMGGGDDDGTQSVDARRVDARLVDARPVDAPGPPIDARPVDAALPPIDSGGMSGFCMTTAECSSMPGTCCFVLVPGSPGICVPGTEQLGVCLPN